jgi:hypothetical protein
MGVGGHSKNRVSGFGVCVKCFFSAGVKKIRSCFIGAETIASVFFETRKKKRGRFRPRLGCCQRLFPRLLGCLLGIGCDIRGGRGRCSVGYNLFKLPFDEGGEGSIVLLRHDEKRILQGSGNAKRDCGIV